jgi:hypothetical protein
MKSKSLILVTILSLSGAGQSLFAANILPIWEYLINNSNPPLPPMANFLNDVTDSDLGDGHSVLDTIGPLRRYDANRLLIGVRENGINETATNLTAAQINLSTNFPDRSLIWINPTNGQPLGIALKIGLYPITIDAGFMVESIAAGNPDYTNQYYWSFDISSDGRIFTGYKNRILRYDPDGVGGISPTPHVVFTLATNLNVHGNLYTSAGSFPMIRVRGTGTNTVILAGGMSSTRGAYRLATTNGSDFFITSWLPGGWNNAGSGAFSSLIPAPNPSSPGEEWVFGGWFPGSSSGNDSSFTRMTTSSPYTDPANNFTNSTGFSPGADPSTNSPKYNANFIGCVETRADLNYIVVYGTPSWGSPAVNNGLFDPGWFAIHDRDTGAFLSSREIDVRESDAFLTADNEGKWEGTHGFVSLNKLPSGGIELLWCSGVYGYGRYLVDPILQITNFSVAGNSASITFRADAKGQVERSTNLTTWQNVGVPSNPGTLIIDTPAPISKAFYRIHLAP